MSTYTSTEWTCDRCGKTQVLGALNASVDQPIGWAAIYEVKPPRMHITESDKRPDQICRDCVDALHDWFLAGKTTP